eukprot:CAMPEP_0198592532 /NCGR_PEP_ID=MMETSP1462-20131121/138262_1 /TAXON_ID=1333877 /ORGANISM="Brandtodinium nutriculum, Strain RCC3387" /LENGTH=113 /DNA_ID=CAMNT_0044324113 /DNA_START=54 /DNA_END=391 /DNA_ORIENTATION=+
MKIYVTFCGEEQASFIVLLDAAETVAGLRRRIGGDYRSVFPARPPLCFFRMSTAEGFFLTDSAALREVLEEGDTVTCHRADEEATDMWVPGVAKPEGVEDILVTFRAQVAYVA